MLYPLHYEGHEHKDSAEPGDIFNCLQQKRHLQPPYWLQGLRVGDRHDIGQPGGADAERQGEDPCAGKNEQ